MALSRELKKRCNEACELCSSNDKLEAWTVAPRSGDRVEDQVALCGKCARQISGQEDLDENHWRCLNESMWSEVAAVQVLAYRMLSRLGSTNWATYLLDMLYLEESTMEWAKEGIEDEEDKVVHKDANGSILMSGDTVVLIKDLKVKGSSLVAKRGTAVRRIRLVHDNPEYIEGKVEGQTVVILTQYVKK